MSRQGKTAVTSLSAMILDKVYRPNALDSVYTVVELDRTLPCELCFN